MKISIYTKHKGPRLQYVCNFIFSEVLSVDHEIVTDNQQSGVNKVRINYSPQPELPGFWILPSGLLEDSGIKALQKIAVDHEDHERLFQVDNSECNFDIFSAVFFMITRYEEYLPGSRDRYGRYPAAASIAFKRGIIEKPVVNNWILILYNSLRSKYPELRDIRFKPGFIPTIDIDNPWAYLNKSLLRTLGGLGKNLVPPWANDFHYRLRVLRGKEPDPYDSYNYIFDHHGPELRVFVLLGTDDKRDSKISPHNPAWRTMIRKLSRSFRVGLHPSWSSNRKLNVLLKEKDMLEKILEHPVRHSRQHFLKLELPVSYRNLIEAGITEDYSMGYAEVCGFRAGTSFPFSFYDLEREEETSLRIFPFTLMDRTLKDYLKLSDQEAREKISSLLRTIAESGGNFIPVWHNESLGNSREWDGWFSVYQHLQEGKGQLLNKSNSDD